MPFTFDSNSLIDSTALSRFVFDQDDASSGLSAQKLYSIELLADAISTQIIRYVSSNIKRATYTEVWDGAGSDELVPTEWPIRSITSVKVSGNNDFSSAGTIDSSMYYHDAASIKFRDSILPVGRGTIQVVYEAGYDNVPKDIQLAFLLQFQWLYKKIGKGDAMVGLGNISKAVAGGSESQSKDASITASGLIGEVIGLLAPYRRFEVPLSIMFTRTS